LRARELKNFERFKMIFHDNLTDEILYDEHNKFRIINYNKNKFINVFKKKRRKKRCYHILFFMYL
jgi:hypothetical protein